MENSTEGESPQTPNIVPCFINVAEVARRMGKRKEWLYQRLKGYKVNGKVATFKPEERIQLGEVLLEMWRELADAVNVKGDGLPNPHIDCIKRLVDAFSFDKGSDNLTEQIAALNNANRILEALRPPSNCTEVEMPSNEY